MKPEEIEPVLFALSAQAEPETMAHFRKKPDVENKLAAGYDPVTLADKGAEAAIRNYLGRNFPDHGIVGEEEPPVNETAEYCWIIDPVDGTRAFITGLPSWGTLIGLSHQGRPVAGLMHQPFTGEIYYTAGDGSYMQRQGESCRLATSPVTDIAHATMMTTTPELFLNGDAVSWDNIRRKTLMTRYGFDCYAYCMVAAGHIELVVECGLKPYDIAPLIPIIEQAGGVVRSWDGGSAADGGKVVAAANETLLKQALACLR